MKGMKMKTGEVPEYFPSGLLAAGFKRIGVAKHFIHADVNAHLPQPCIWTY